MFKKLILLIGIGLMFPIFGMADNPIELEESLRKESLSMEGVLQVKFDIRKEKDLMRLMEALGRTKPIPFDDPEIAEIAKKRCEAKASFEQATIPFYADAVYTLYGQHPVYPDKWLCLPDKIHPDEAINLCPKIDKTMVLLKMVDDNRGFVCQKPIV